MSKTFWLYEAIKGVPEGIRNDTAVRLVGRWYRRYLTCDEVALLLVSWNERNSPPMSHSELKQIFKYTKKWRKSWPGEDDE